MGRESDKAGERKTDEENQGNQNLVHDPSLGPNESFKHSCFVILHNSLNLYKDPGDSVCESRYSWHLPHSLPIVFSPVYFLKTSPFLMLIGIIDERFRTRG
jgi:hypothetical protein